ncbi:hypothetical protein AABB24_018238, partial [Solanum stoloniferum]
FFPAFIPYPKSNLYPQITNITPKSTSPLQIIHKISLFARILPFFQLSFLIPNQIFILKSQTLLINQLHLFKVSTKSVSSLGSLQSTTLLYFRSFICCLDPTVLKLKIVFNIAMSETNTPRRITRGSIAAMEIKKKSKFLNSPRTLDLNDELVRSGSSKRKEGSTMKVGERKIVKRKVKDVVSGMIGKHVVNEEQEERSEEELEVYVNHNIVTDLKGKLTLTQFNRFKDTCFGAYTKMHVCGAQPQIFRCLMVCELEDSSPDELFFRINHTTLRFGIQEFAIITGLNCFADKDDFLFDTSEPNRLINQYFEGKSIIRKAELISKYKNKVWGDGNDDDVVKFTILYFISTFIYSGEKKSSSIPRIQFDLVESGRYHEYPWGKDAFSKLVKSITKKMDAKKKYYRIDASIKE